MKKIIVFIVLIIFVDCENRTKAESPLATEQSKQPYETTWLQITKTEKGYVVYNYPSLWNDGETQSPMKITVKNNQLIWNVFSDDVMTYTFDNVESNADKSYFFRVGNFYCFKWVDEKKHIAQWIIYYGDDRQMTDYDYIDSVYNTYPIVDYVWPENNEEY